MIGEDFKYPYLGPFDHAYMVKLFEYGLSRGITGVAWHKSPPGYAR
jgi:hypothetical protein